jgi:phage FluMu protein Com
MPFLALVHLRELRCEQCNELLAQAGARSFLVDERGEAMNFSESEPPEEMSVAVFCSRKHENVLYVPNEISAEETLYTPEDAPIARDAIMLA